ncbi:MAG: transcriptional regulator, partial [Betaproteobacteria bacterium]|nr:transcriptional regulator [Betaproteobacteria bacterium]
MTTLPDTSPQGAGTATSGTATAAPDALHFVGFSILPGQRRLLIDGKSAKIGARAFDLLMVLVSSRDRVVSKDELLDKVWQGLVVDESNLPVHVSLLRRLCGAAVIATVPGRGYQFTAVSRGVST